MIRRFSSSLVRRRLQSSGFVLISTSQRLLSTSPPHAIASCDRVNIFKDGENRVTLHKLRQLCADSYTDPSTSILEDFINYPDSQLSFQIQHKLGDNALKELILCDLINLYKSKKYETFQQSIQLLTEWKVIPRYIIKEENRYSSIISGKIDLARETAMIKTFLIALTSVTGNNHLSASLLLDTEKLPFGPHEVSDRYVKLVIKNVSSSDAGSDNITNYYIVLRLLIQFPSVVKSFTFDERNDLLEYFISEEGRYPSFANRAFRLLGDSSAVAHTDEGVFDIRLVYQLLKANLQYGNLAQSVWIWDHYIKNSLHMDTIDPGVVSSLIKELSKRKNLKTLLDQVVFRDLEHNGSIRMEDLYNLPYLGSTLIQIFGKREDLNSRFSQLVRTLKTPLSRRTLESLLKVFVHKGDTTSSERILTSLFNRAPGKIDNGLSSARNGLSATEFNVLVRKLLADGEYEQAIDLTFKQLSLSQNYSVPKFALVSLFEYALIKKSQLDNSPGKYEFELEFEHHFNRIMDATVTMLRRLENKINALSSEKNIGQDSSMSPSAYIIHQTQLDDRRVFTVFSSVVLNFILENYGARAGQKLYTRLSQKESLDFKSLQNLLLNKPSQYDEFSILTGSPTADLFKVSPYLLITEKQKVPFLLEIIRSSQPGEDQQLMEWCLHEMIKVGLSLSEAVELISFHFPDDVSKIFLRGETQDP